MWIYTFMVWIVEFAVCHWHTDLHQHVKEVLSHILARYFMHVENASLDKASAIGMNYTLQLLNTIISSPRKRYVMEKNLGNCTTSPFTLEFNCSRPVRLRLHAEWVACKTYHSTRSAPIISWMWYMIPNLATLGSFRSSKSYKCKEGGTINEALKEPLSRNNSLFLFRFACFQHTFLKTHGKLYLL